MCVTEAPVPVEPSPKFQLTVYGDVPPMVVAVKVTGVFTSGVLGDTVKLVESGIWPKLKFTLYQSTLTELTR